MKTRRSRTVAVTRALGLVTGAGLVAAVTWANMPQQLVPSEPVPVTVGVASGAGIELRSLAGEGPALSAELVPAGQVLRTRVTVRSRLERPVAVELVANAGRGRLGPDDLGNLGVELRTGDHLAPFILAPGQTRSVPVAVGLRPEGGPAVGPGTDRIAIELVPRVGSGERSGATRGEPGATNDVYGADRR